MSEIKRIEIGPYCRPWWELKCRKCEQIFYLQKNFGSIGEEDSICESCIQNISVNINDFTLDEILSIFQLGGCRRYDRPTAEKLAEEKKLSKSKKPKRGAKSTRISNAAIDMEDRIMRGDLREEDGF